MKEETKYATEAEMIATRIWNDLDDRKGFDLSTLDDDIQKEIYQAWVSIVSEVIE